MGLAALFLGDSGRGFYWLWLHSVACTVENHTRLDQARSEMPNQRQFCTNTASMAYLINFI